MLQLKEIKNKKVRQFYEQQNDRLNDWLEVDALVMALADDVLDAMNPDPDGDGHQEERGGISFQSGNIWEFLPEDEKEKRAKAEKKAKWAIYINVLANVLLVIAKVCAWSSHIPSSHILANTRSSAGCSHPIILALVDRFPGRLGPGPAMHTHRLFHKSSRTMASQRFAKALPRRTTQA